MSMPSNFDHYNKDVIGEKIGQLTIIGEFRKPMGGKGLLKRYVICLCDCGNPTPVEKNLADLRRQAKQAKTPPSCGHGRMTALDFSKYVGTKLGTLTVLEMVKKFGHNSGAGFKCLCDCGVEKTFVCSEMLGYRAKGLRRHCGARVHKVKDRKGLSEKAYQSLLMRHRGMEQRCTNPNEPQYRNYGGRGIKVYAGWYKNLPAYIDYFISLYGLEVLEILVTTPDNEVDRIDVNGDYEPGNVRIINTTQNANNKRDTCYLNIVGNIYSAKEAAVKFGIIRHVQMYNRKTYMGWKDLDVALRPSTKQEGVDIIKESFGLQTLLDFHKTLQVSMPADEIQRLISEVTGLSMSDLKSHEEGERRFVFMNGGSFALEPFPFPNHQGCFIRFTYKHSYNPADLIRGLGGYLQPESVELEVSKMVGRCEEINPKYAYIMQCEKTPIDWSSV